MDINNTCKDFLPSNRKWTDRKIRCLVQKTISLISQEKQCPWNTDMEDNRKTLIHCYGHTLVNEPSTMGYSVRGHQRYTSKCHQQTSDLKWGATNPDYCLVQLYCEPHMTKDTNSSMRNKRILKFHGLSWTH